MKLGYKLWIDNDGKAFGRGPFELLCCIEEYGSINKAAKELNLSYSKAWKIINLIESKLGFKFLQRETGGAGGGGTYLTEEARIFLKKYDSFVKDADLLLNGLFKKHFGEGRHLNGQ